MDIQDLITSKTSLIIENSKILISSNLKRVKLDIGLSYSAPQSQLWLEKEPDLIVFGFEPNPASVQNILNGNIQKRHHEHGTPVKSEYINTRFFVLPFALDNVEKIETSDFYVTSIDCGTSSLYKPKTNSGLGNSSIIKVPVISLKSFLDLFPWDQIPYIDYIKIDAQGADLNILKSAQDYLKERVVYVTAEPECEKYENSQHNCAYNINEFMLQNGFERVNHPNTTDPTYLNKKFVYLKDIYIQQT